MHIRLATVDDAESICAIYNPEVTETTLTLDMVPRTVDEQRTYIEQRSGGLAVLVATADEGGGVGGGVGEGDGDGELIGFGSLSFYRDRPGYRTSVENSIYIARSHQGRGVGSALLGELVDVAAARGFHAIFARIVGPQKPSVALHERHGYTLVGIERQVARKFARWHDVAIMQRML